MKMRWFIGYLGAVGALLAATARAQDAAKDTPPPSAGAALTMTAEGAEGLTESLRQEARAAIARGLDWLRAKQNATEIGGHWSNPLHPALTGLPLWALVRGGDRESPEVRRAIAFLKANARENGGIYRDPPEATRGGGLSNYNTAICMVALHLTGDPDVVPIVQRARRFVARSQHLGGDVYHGGMGYDAGTGRPYADLSNSYIAYEAMRMTESVEDLRREGEERADLDWKAAREFIQRTHNEPTVNPAPWVSDDPRDRGGFVYHPNQTRAGTVKGADGIVKFRSMQGMTYAGLLSYIYADVDRSDPRVEATVNWAVNHWNLDANNTKSDGREAHDTQDEREGLYYLYNVMAKGLAAYGRDVLRPQDRPAFNWREQLIRKLLSLQRTDPQTGHGYWVNEVGRYWESDPVLVTSYALIALETALGE